MRVHMRVAYEDSPDTSEDVVAWDTDLVALEQKFDIDATILSTRQRMEWLAFLAWHVLNRKGRAGSFDEWIARGVEVLPQGDDVEGEETPEASGESAD